MMNRQQTSARQWDDFRQKQQAWQSQGLCRYCDGPLKGVIGKKCAKCGQEKDY
ncbi:MAG: hypothetical protein LBJ11_02130 [Oscillospiraceae bacterium]|jgi:hypothetical protein|nr:hypothetical protein [Oscillospiraceae bacterium]